MPRESKIKDSYYIKMKNKNLHLDVNNASKVEQLNNEEINSPDLLNVSNIQQLNSTNKTIISFQAVLINIKDNIINSSSSLAKRNIVCHAFDLNG